MVVFDQKSLMSAYRKFSENLGLEFWKNVNHIPCPNQNRKLPEIMFANALTGHPCPVWALNPDPYGF